MRLRTLLALACCCGPAFPQSAAAPTRFAASIEAFAAQDRTSPPPQQSILFIGSSIFRLWKNLNEQMAPLPVFNRAFGGSQTPDLLYYLDQVVLPYNPKVIVYYCGSNDINAGRSPEQIADGYRQFVARVHAKLPQTRLLYVSINRAPQKMKDWDKVDEANRLVRAYTATDKRLSYVDVNPALFDAEGKPRLELYVADKLHFHEPAYVEFTKIIRPALEKIWDAVKPQS